MHGYVRAALAAGAALCDRAVGRGETLRFLHHTPGDLILRGHKVAGSAQRRRTGALLQHRGVLLARSDYTPGLPGLAELTGRAVVPGRVAARYGSAAWNAKR